MSRRLVLSLRGGRARQWLERRGRMVFGLDLRVVQLEALGWPRSVAERCLVGEAERSPRPMGAMERVIELAMHGRVSAWPRWTHRYAWGNNPERARMKGRRCRVLAVGGMGTALLEVEGYGRTLTSRRALRRLEGPACAR